MSPSLLLMYVCFKPTAIWQNTLADKTLADWLPYTAKYVARIKKKFEQIKLWWIGLEPQNLSKFSTAKVLCYTVLQVAFH